MSGKRPMVVRKAPKLPFAFARLFLHAGGMALTTAAAVVVVLIFAGASFFFALAETALFSL